MKINFKIEKLCNKVQRVDVNVLHMLSVQFCFKKMKFILGAVENKNNKHSMNNFCFLQTMKQN